MTTELVCSDEAVPDIIRPPGEHNHPADDVLYKRSEIIGKLRKEVQKDATRPLGKTFKSVVTSSCQSGDIVPTYQSVCSILKRERAQSLPTLPKFQSEIDLSGEWAQSLDGEAFVVPSDRKDMIIFATRSKLLALGRCETIYVDGTFKTCPRLFKQLFTIHGLFGRCVVPLVYVLLSDKSAKTYYELLGLLRDAVSEAGATLNPRNVLSDFESGFVTAISRQFPNAKHSGCHFHFGQALWREMQHLKLTRACRVDLDIKTFFQSCVALAFVPEGEVVDQFELLLADLPESTRIQLAEFVDYMRSNWLDTKYPIRLWNKYGDDHLHRLV